MEIKEIIMFNSTYEVLPGIYSVAKVNSDFKCDDIFMVTRDFWNVLLYIGWELHIKALLMKKELQIDSSKCCCTILCPSFYCNH